MKGDKIVKLQKITAYFFLFLYMWRNKNHYLTKSWILWIPIIRCYSLRIKFKFVYNIFPFKKVRNASRMNKRSGSNYCICRANDTHIFCASSTREILSCFSFNFTNNILCWNNSCNDVCKITYKLWELVVVFIERTILAIIIGSIFMHILF